MKRVFFCALAGLLLGATGPQAITPSSTDSSVYQLPDTIVVTANRFGLPVEKTIWPARIVTEARLSVAPSLDQAIDGVGGADIRNYSGLGSLATLSSWGALARHVLLLYDGRPVRDYSLGGFNLGDYSADEFSRVEFLKGPQSAFYGSDAVAGVINLITPSTLLDRLNVATRFGSLNTRQFRVDVAKNLGTAGVGGFADLASSDNRRANAGAERLIAGLRSDYLSADGRHMLRLSGRLLDDSVGIPGPLPNPAMIPDVGNAESSSLFDHQTDRKYAVDAQYRYNLTTTFSAQVDGFWERKEVNYFAEYTLASLTESKSRHRSSGFGARLQRLIDRHSFSSGVDFLSGSVRESSYDSSDYGVSASSWEKQQEQIDVWSAANLAATQQMSFDLSGRLQLVKDRETQPSYDLGVILGPLHDLTLRIAYGYAFRLPSIADQFVTGPYTQGNPDLQPETSRALAATLSVAPDHQWGHGDVTLFYRTVSSLIQYVFDANSYKYVPTNVDRMHSTGVDFSAVCSPTSYWHLSWSGVWQSARQSAGTSDDVSAFYIPKLKWRLDAAWQAQPRVEFSAGLTYTGRRTIQMSNDTKIISSVYELGGSVSAAVIKYMTVALILSDITDQRRPDQFGFSLTDGDYPSVGRTISVRTVAHLY